MNICLLNDSFPPVIDGVANVVMNYAKILTEGGDRVLVGTPFYPDTDYEVYPYPVVPYQSLNTTKLASGYRAGNPLDMRALHRMAQFDPDVIHVHSPASAAIVARVLRDMTGAPIVYTYHTKYDMDIARAVRSKQIQKEAIRALVDNISACDEVWAVSEGAGSNLTSLGFAGDIRVMENGVDFPKGKASDEAVEQATAGYDLPEGVPVFLFVGRMVRYKGLPLIADALSILHAEGRDFRMVFIGGGDDAEELQHTIRERGLAEKVFFLGPVTDRERLRAWNTRADLFVFPSTFDTNGLVVREAAACGLAGLLVRGSCAAEGITDGRNGFLVEEEASSIARVMAQGCDDIDMLHRVGDCAMEEIYCGWEDRVAAARAEYGALCERASKGFLPDWKEQDSDTAVSLAARAAVMSGEIWDRQARFVEGMMENADSFREGMRVLQEGVKEGMYGIRASVQERIGGWPGVKSMNDDRKLPYAGIIFDLDGTLLDTLGDLADSVNAALRALSYPEHPKEAYKQMVGNGFSNLMMRALPPEERTKEHQDQMLAVFTEEYGARYMKTTAPYDGIPELLCDLAGAGYLLGVNSNKRDAYTKALIKKHFPDIPFSLVLGGREDVPHKPDPASVHMVLRAMDVPPERAVCVGDSAVDIETAIHAGTDAIGVLWGFREVEELTGAGADRIVADVDALRALLLPNAPS